MNPDVTLGLAAPNVMTISKFAVSKRTCIFAFAVVDAKGIGLSSGTAVLTVPNRRTSLLNPFVL
jgi:hypothetical protein